MHKLLSLAKAKQQQQPQPAVVNPDYSAQPVSSLPFGLAPRRVISKHHDPSLGYRAPSDTNFEEVNSVIDEREELAAEEEQVEEDAWIERQALLTAQHTYEQTVGQEEQNRFQKLRILALRPPLSPLRPQPSRHRFRQGGGRAPLDVDAPNADATLVPHEHRYFVKDGESERVLPPLEADGSRMDVALVEEWANKMEAFLNKRYKRESWEYIEEIQLFYNSYCHEALRRIEGLSPHLGSSMTRILKAYNNTFDKIRNLTHSHISLAKEDFEGRLRALKEEHDLHKRQHEEHMNLIKSTFEPAKNRGTSRFANNKFFRKAAKKMTLGMRLGAHVNKNRKQEEMLRNALAVPVSRTSFSRGSAGSNQQEPGADGASNEQTKEALKKRKSLLVSKQFSNVDRNLQKLHDDLMTSIGRSPKLDKYDTSGDKTEWVKLSGVTVDIAHMSAMAQSSVDMTHVLARGQKIKIGPKRFTVNYEGDFYPSCIPLNAIWMNEATYSIPLYIEKSACKSEYDDGSDMEPDDDEEWRLVPATGTVIEGEAAVITSADVRSMVKRGSHVKIGGQLFHVAQYGTYSDEEFPLASPWIGKGNRNMHIYVLEDTSVDEDGGDAGAAAPVEDAAVSPWVTLHGVTLAMKAGEKVATSNADLRNVLQRGRLVSLDHEVFTITRDGDFTSTEVPLDAAWPHSDRDDVHIKLRRRDAETMINTLSGSLRILGMKMGHNHAHMVSVDTQTAPAAAKQPSVVAKTKSATVATLGMEDNGPCEEAEVETVDADGRSFVSVAVQTEKRKKRKASAVSKADKASKELERCLDRFQGLKKKKKKLLPKPLVLKTIAMILADKIRAMKDDPDINECLPVFIVDWFFHKYGMKKLADRQLGKFLASMKKVKDHPRIHFMQKLLGIHVDGNSNIHHVVDMNRAFRCLHNVKRSPLSGIHALHQMRKEGSPLECSLISGFDNLRKALTRSTLYKSECVHDHNSWPDLRSVALEPPAKEFIGSTRIVGLDFPKESFLRSAFQAMAFLGKKAEKLEKLEPIRKFVFVKRVLGQNAREDYKAVLGQSVYLYTYIEYFVRIMRRSCQLEAAAVRLEIRRTFRTFGEGLEGRLTFDEFRVLLKAALGDLAGKFKKKRAMRLYKSAMVDQEKGIINEDSFLEVIDSSFNNEQLSELVRMRKGGGGGAGKPDVASEGGGEGEMLLDIEDTFLMDEIGDGQNKNLSEKELTNITNYDIIKDAWEDSKEEIDEYLESIKSSNEDAVKGVTIMIESIEKDLRIQQADQLEQAWSKYRTLTTMARREKGFVALSTTLRVKRFVAKLRAKKSVVLSLNKTKAATAPPPGDADTNAASKIQALHRGRMARKQMMEEQEAATKLQAIQRGRESRKKHKKGDGTKTKTKTKKKNKKKK
jgi:hypothetical protein